MKKDYNLKDEGDRTEYPGGGLRDRPKGKGKGRYDLITPFLLRRLAVIYEKGSEKYNDRNWEKGMPFSVFLDSALRHITQAMMGMEDEDHWGQATWNLACILHFQELGREDLNDLPEYFKKKTKKKKT